MNQQALMQQALGPQWAQLPPALQAHYQLANHTDVGALDIEYPGFMQMPLNLLHGIGALLHRRGEAVPTTVKKWMDGHTQHWQRTISFADGRIIHFKSHWHYGGGNELIEYVNPFLGLRMAVHVDDGKLIYEGRHFVLKLGSLKLPIPEWLLLGHTSIVETAETDHQFTMDFRLRHPLFGQIYRYAGTFLA
jgi:hypothetical protein